MEDGKFYINGVEIPTPSSFKVSFSDFSKNAYRDSNGISHYTLLRKNTRKAYLEWRVLNDDDMKILLDALDDQWFTFSYPKDPKTKRRHEMTVYTGDRNVQLYSLAKNLDVWTEVSFNLIER